MVFSDCNEYSDYRITCKAKFEAVSTLDYYGEEVAAAAVLLAVAVFAFRKRRSIRTTEEALQANFEVNNFEMMKDSGVRV